MKKAFDSCRTSRRCRDGRERVTAIRRAVCVALPAIALGGAWPVIAGPPVWPLAAPEYSFDAESPTVLDGWLGSADVLERGFARPLPILDGEVLGLLSESDEIDAMSGAHDELGEATTLAVLFSVDRATVGVAAPDPDNVENGVPYNVTDQATRRHAAGDQFIAADSFSKLGVIILADDAPARNNVLSRNNFDEGGSDFHAFPAAHASTLVNETTGQDGVDAMAHLTRRDNDGTIERMYFSVASDSPSLPDLTVQTAGDSVKGPAFPAQPNPSGADIYVMRRDLGGCCLPVAECELLGKKECAARGGEWLGLDSTCEECDLDFGACCLPDGCFEEMLHFVCLAFDGDFFAGRTCEQAECNGTDSGGCCLDEMCIDRLTDAQCEAINGTFFADVECNEMPCSENAEGACCFDGGACVERATLQNCLAAEGVFSVSTTCVIAACGPVAPALGGGPDIENLVSQCEPPGPCCLQGQSCEMLDVVSCDAMGGLWLGEDKSCVLCVTDAPCCLPHQGCVAVTAMECDSVQGHWLGADTNCASCPPPIVVQVVDRYATYADLGLNIDDDIDGIAVFDEDANGMFDGDDLVLFTLAPGSPSLTVIEGASEKGAAADIYIAAPAKAPRVFASASMLGLGAENDNIDALDVMLEVAGPAGSSRHGIRACGTGE